MGVGVHAHGGRNFLFEKLDSQNCVQVFFGFSGARGLKKSEGAAGVEGGWKEAGVRLREAGGWLEGGWRVEGGWREAGGILEGGGRLERRCQISES
jgi:hypothetical protein